MLQRIFNTQASKSVASAAFVIGAMSMVSRALGLLRDRVLAGEFGAGPELDAYYAAFRIPDFLYNLLIVGALSAGFIPVFTAVFNRDRNSGHDEAWRMVSNVLNTVMIASFAAATLMFVWSKPLTRLLAPGFSPEQLEQTAALTKIMLLSPILLGASAVIGGGLQSLKRFLIFSLSPILYNVGIITGALFFTPTWGVQGLAFGVVLGAALHLFVQLPTMLYLGYRYRWVSNPWDENVRQIIRLMGPRTLSLAISQINLLVVTIMASTLSVGSLTVFNLANNLQSFPLGLFGISFAIAAFPTLAEYARDRLRFIASLSQAFRQILYLIIPSSALLIVLRAQIVRVLLGSGRFDWEDTVLTIDTLAIFSISLFAQALIPLLVRAYYARLDTMTPFLTALGSALLNVILAIVLLRPLGIVGLALSTSIASLMQLAVLWILLRIALGSFDDRAILLTTIRISFASLLMVLVAQVCKYVTAPLTGTQTFIGVAIQGGTAAVAGLATYLIVTLVLRSPEAIDLVEAFRRRKRHVVVTEVVGDGPTS